MVGGIGSMLGSSGLAGMGGLGGAAGAGGASPLPTPAPGAGAGSSFADMLGSAVLTKPSQASNQADQLAAAFAAGANVDTHTLAIATAKAGVEIQISTRVISQAASAVRQLFQMQI